MDAGDIPQICGASDLAMHGTTQPVLLEVTFNGAFAQSPVLGPPQHGFSATTAIDRTLFGASHPAPDVGAKVDIWIKAEFVRASEPHDAPQLIPLTAPLSHTPLTAGPDGRE